MYPYSEFFGPYAGKYAPEKLQIRTVFTQCIQYGLLQMRWKVSLKADRLDIRNLSDLN